MKIKSFIRLRRRPRACPWGSISILMFLLLVSLQTICFADTVYLRNGRVVKGEIIEHGPYYIMMRIKNKRQKYFNSEIDRIEEEKEEEKPGTTGGIMDIDVTQYEEISEEKARLIIALMEASGVRRNMEQSIEQVIAQAQEEKREKFRNLFNIKEIIERLIPLYDGHYSEEDLKEIIRFYESPAGKKVLEVTPQIMKESVVVSVQYLQEKAAP